MKPQEVSAISDIKDIENVRVILYYNSRFVHVPLSSLLKDLQSKVNELDTRVTALEP